MKKFFLDKSNAILLIIDIQERLAPVMKVRDSVVRNCLHLIELATTYTIPIVVTEQYPKGLGKMVGELRDALQDHSPIEKLTFSCCEEPSFLSEMKKFGRKSVILILV